MLPPSLLPPAAGQQELRDAAHRTFFAGRRHLASSRFTRLPSTVAGASCAIPITMAAAHRLHSAHPAANVEAVDTARGTAARGIVVVDDRAAVPSNAANSSVPRGGSAEEGTGLAGSLQGLCSRRVAVAWGWASTRR